MINVLHLSDVHYSNDPSIHPFSVSGENGGVLQRQSLVDAVCEGLEAAKLTSPLSGIVISGDLRWSTSKEGFALAVREIGRLAERLGIRRDRIVVIPGNHDADWNEPPEKRFAAYQLAYAEITGSGAVMDDESITTFTSENESVVIYGVSSAAIESKDDAGTGMVGENKLRALLRKPLPETDGKKTIKILCLHHHVLPVSYVAADYFTDSRRRTSVTLDAMAVLNLCAEHDVALLVHGHQHQPTLAAFTCISPINQDLSHAYSVWVSGAGSAGLDRKYLGDAGCRHFQVLQFSFPNAVPTASFVAFVSDTINSLKFVPTRGTASVQLSQRLANATLIESDHCRLAKSACLSIRDAFPEATLPAKPTDDSDLFIVLLKCAQCRPTNDRLRALAKTNRIEGIYDLYGDYDILLKIRCGSQEEFERAVLKPLLLEGLIIARYDTENRRYDDVTILNITSELLPHKEFRRGIDRIKGIKVFILFSDVKRAHTLKAQCEGALKHVWASGWNGRVAISGLFFSDHHAVAEIYMSCGSYAALNEVTQKLEEYLENSPQAPRKITMLGQSIWEPVS